LSNRFLINHLLVEREGWLGRRLDKYACRRAGKRLDEESPKMKGCEKEREIGGDKGKVGTYADRRKNVRISS
jgi:hypothetical protein